MLDDEQLKEWRALAEAATAGEWHAFHHEGYGWRVHSDERSNIVSGDWNEADADFISAARTALPALLDEVERLRGLLTLIREDWLTVHDGTLEDPDDVEAWNELNGRIDQALGEKP